MCEILSPIFIGVSIGCFYQAMFGIPYGCKKFVNIWMSKISNEAFNKRLSEMFSDRKIVRTYWRVLGGGHAAWVANGYYGFHFDEFSSEDLSFFQKRKFFKLFRTITKVVPITMP